MYKYQRINKGLSTRCIHHGLHKEWIVFPPSGNTPQCLRCKRISSKKCYRNTRIKRLISSARQRKNGKLSFNLDEAFIKGLLLSQNGRCALSGSLINESNFSIDRIDNTKGYVQENVQLLIYEVNKMKSDISQKRFIELCQMISNKGKK